MDLYLSELYFESQTDHSQLYKEATQAVLSFCRDRNIHCWRSLEFEEYNIIEERIRQSHVLVAIIDEYWRSSTWKGQEFSYAAGGRSAQDHLQGKAPHVRIAMLVGDTELLSPYLGGPVPIVVTRTISELYTALRGAYSL